ncbi:hypothetical protein BJ912DRAFT_932628 [Pholiota molesta]|nr:hypothetical protein BJ912DRAFT_932628 [Pholiota molesta]
MTTLQSPKDVIVMLHSATCHKDFLEMADKIPHRRIIPVYCTQPAPKLMAWEESLAELRNFSPIREFRDSSPESAPRRPRYRRQPPFQDDCASHRVLNDENIPPPSTQPRRPQDSALFGTAAPGGSQVQTIASTQRNNNNKRKRIHSESLENVDSNSEGGGHGVAKKQRFSSDDEAHLLEGVVRVADSIVKMAAEAREDREKFNNTLMELLHELQRKS